MPRRNSILSILILVVSILEFVLAFASPNSPFRIGISRFSNLVNPGGQTGPPIHAVHIEFSDYDLRGSQGAAIDGYLGRSKANLISLTAWAGRVDLFLAGLGF